MSVPLDWKLSERFFAATMLPVAETEDNTTPRVTVLVCWIAVVVAAGFDPTTTYASTPTPAAIRRSPRLSQRRPPRPKLGARLAIAAASALMREARGCGGVPKRASGSTFEGVGTGSPNDNRRRG